MLQGLVAFESNASRTPGSTGGQPSANNPIGTGNAVELPAGFGSAADDGGNVAKPEVMLPAPRIEPVVEVVPQPSRKVDFAAVEGAAGYRVRTAADPAFTQEVRERVVPTPIAIVDSTRDGTWYLAARGISPTGVEGYDATINLVFDARPAPPIVTQPNDKATLFGTTTKLEWLEPEGIGRFRLQIARDAAFRELIVDEDVTEPRHTYTARDDEPAPRKRYWRIAAIDDTGRGPFQVAREFTQRDAGGPAASAEVSDTGGTRLSWPPIPDASYIVALKPLTQGATPASRIPEPGARAHVAPACPREIRDRDHQRVRGGPEIPAQRTPEVHDPAALDRVGSANQSSSTTRLCRRSLSRNNPQAGGCRSSAPLVLQFPLCTGIVPAIRRQGPRRRTGIATSLRGVEPDSGGLALPRRLAEHRTQ